MDMSQYLEIFIDEAKEHVKSLNSRLLELEQNTGSKRTVTEIFRASHSLKGMAGTLGYKRMQSLAHGMETVSAEVRNGTLAADASMVDTLFACLDALESYLENIQNTGEEGTDDSKTLLAALKGYLGQDDAKEAAEKEPGEEDKWKNVQFADAEKLVLSEAAKQGMNLIGITVYVQESCILKAARAFLVYRAVEEVGEIVVSVPGAQDIEDERFDLDFSLIILSHCSPEEIIKRAERVAEIEKVSGGLIDAPEYRQDAPKQEPARKAPVKTEKKPSPKHAAKKTVRVDAKRLDALVNLASELVTAKNSLAAAASADHNASAAVGRQVDYLGSVVSDLYESVMKMRMVPIESVVNKFPRMIRDLSKTLEKKIELTVSGAETEFDRTVVDELGTPLMHLLKNCADYGIETAQARKEKGKPETGAISLHIYTQGSQVVIEVADDGSGIDVDAVRKAAISCGAITAEEVERMPDEEVINLLFLPGLSTAKAVSAVSGRGLGLDIVKSRIMSLCGTVEVKTQFGKGSTWIIRLPLTLAVN